MVEIYSYIIPVPEEEDGMNDSGADIYFVGIATMFPYAPYPRAT